MLNNLKLIIIINFNNKKRNNKLDKMKLKNLIIILILYMNIDLIKTAWIPNQNCPHNQGICFQSECICLYGFATLKESGTKNNQIFWNYRQINRYVPLFLEFFFPTIGLFYLGRIFEGIFKLCLIIVLFTIPKNRIHKLRFFIIFVIIYHLIDISCILFAIYYDGYGIPLL